MVVSTQKYTVEFPADVPGNAGGQGGFPGHGLPLVSILIPTHNRLDYAELALQSALAQTYPHIEIIVSDSSDDLLTQERFAPYLARYSSIRCARAHGCGDLANFQYCYARSADIHIKYLMDHDLFHPKKSRKCGPSWWPSLALAS
jgi:cellulose synthase/poly-beta-1,6-N-acetylglucosamine synthase-like glycosyltransferase